MNALVRKEVRLLLPSFVVGLLVALLIWLFPDEPAPASSLRASLVVLMFMLCPATLVMMTLGSFGRELNAGTFSFLLAQPASRARVWWTKTLLLAAAVVLIWAAWWFSLSHNMNFLAHSSQDRRDAFLMAAVFVIVTYSGGLWTTLLFRQVAAAFWFTVLTPAALVMAVVGLLHKRAEAVDSALAPTLIVVFSIYAVAGFLFARWLFLRAQDTHWTGGTIALPEVRGVASLFGRRGERRQWRPRAASWMKELQLHQSQFVLAAVLVFLHLAVLAARKIGGDFKNSPSLAFVLEQFWVLWMAMPLLVGCATVAEERKLGTLEAQLCLPSRRRTQFIIKIGSALLLSVVLGAVVPLLFEGPRIISGFSQEPTSDTIYKSVRIPGGAVIPLGNIVTAIRSMEPVFWLTGYATMFALVSFYASTLVRNTIQALTPAVLGIFTAGFLFVAASHPNTVLHYPLWRGGLIFLIGGPVMLLVLARLMYWNFKHVLVGWPVWRRNALVLFSALAGVTALTAAIYHRVWENFMTLEPPHGPARLDQSVALKSSYFHIDVQFPDGRNWSSRLDVSMPDLAALLTGNQKVTEVPGSAGYLEGTNWASVARSYRDVIGIQKDGSLWVSEQPKKLSRNEPTPAPPGPPMIRLGQDSDWKAVIGVGARVFLLKTNGTLWGLGSSRGNWKDWPGFSAFVPVQLGTDSDWAKVFLVEHHQMAFQKADGRVWVVSSGLRPDPDDEQMRLDNDLSLTRAPYLEGQKSVARKWIETSPSRDLYLGVGDDGVLRVIGYGGVKNAVNGLGKWRLIPQKIQLGHETNWVALADDRYDVVGLRRDGTLWKLSFATDPITKPAGFSTTPLSRHSDWEGLVETMGNCVVSLAADGSLSYWATETESRFDSGFTLRPLLSPSRRPQLIGNIFGAHAQ
jgi:ABC-type transport system involved in multi-copper enzyme maturation permease subunit